MIKLILTSLLLIFLSSCLGTYQIEKFYHHINYKDFSSTKHTSVYAYNEDGLEDLERKGYIVIGYSSFNGPLQHPNLYKRFGRKVGADIVLVNSNYTETVKGSFYYPKYHQGETYDINTFEQGNFNYDNRSGNYNVFRHSQIMSQGKTTYQKIPYDIQRYDQYAVYLRNPNLHTMEIEESKKFLDPLYDY